MKASRTRRLFRLAARSDQGNDDDTVRRLTFSVTLVGNNSFPLRRTARYCFFSYFSLHGRSLQRRFHSKRKRERTGSDARAAMSRQRTKRRCEHHLNPPFPPSLAVSQMRLSDSRSFPLLFTPVLSAAAAAELTDYRIESVCFPLPRIVNSNEDRQTSTQSTVSFTSEREYININALISFSGIFDPKSIARSSTDQQC